MSPPFTTLPSRRTDPNGWHVIIRCRDNRVIAPTGEARQAFVKSLLEHGYSHPLFCYSLADTHGHNGVKGSREQAAQFARELLASLSEVMPGNLAFNPAHLTPINDQSHLTKRLDYILRQDGHHGIGLDPLGEALAAFDFAGLRPAGAYLRERVRLLLPRLTDADLCRHLPTKPRDSVELAHLRAAAISASIGRISTRRTDLERHAAAVQAAKGSGTANIANALGIGERTVRRLYNTEADAKFIAAIRLQMGCRQAIPLGVPKPPHRHPRNRQDTAPNQPPDWFEPQDAAGWNTWWQEGIS